MINQKQLSHMFSAELLYQRAVKAISRGRTSQALDLAGELLKKRGLTRTRRASIYYLMADAYMESDRFREAASASSSGLKYRFDIEGLLNRAHAQYYLCKYAHALKDYERIIQKCPEHAFALRGAADALIRLGRYKEARVRLRKVIEVNPSYLAAKRTLEQLEFFIRKRS